MGMLRSQSIGCPDVAAAATGVAGTATVGVSTGDLPDDLGAALAMGKVGMPAEAGAVAVADCSWEEDCARPRARGDVGSLAGTDGRVTSGDEGRACRGTD
jgi:hypothetical protein